MVDWRRSQQGWPWHRWVVGVCLLVGLLLAGVHLTLSGSESDVRLASPAATASQHQGKETHQTQKTMTHARHHQQQQTEQPQPPQPQQQEHLQQQQAQKQELQKQEQAQPYCSDPKRRAFFFFAYQPDADLLEFASDLAEKGPFDVHLIVDDNSYNWTTAQAAQYPRLRVRFVDADWVESVKITHFAASPSFQAKLKIRPAMALDKALALAAYMEDDTLPAGSNRALSSDSDGQVFVSPTTGRPTRLRYCRVWFVENDAFIPSVGAALHVDSLVTASGADYASSSQNTARTTPAYYHFRWIAEYFTKTTSTIESAAAAAAAPPTPIRPGTIRRQGSVTPSYVAPSQRLLDRSTWAQTMANAFALSDRFLLEIRDLALDRGRLFFSEPFLPTMAAHWNMTQWVSRRGELTEVWRMHEDADTVNWKWPAMRAACKDPLMRCWFHPIKNVTLRLDYRRQVRQLEHKAGLTARRAAGRSP